MEVVAVGQLEEGEGLARVGVELRHRGEGLLVQTRIVGYMVPPPPSRALQR